MTLALAALLTKPLPRLNRHKPPDRMCQRPVLMLLTIMALCLYASLAWNMAFLASHTWYQEGSAAQTLVCMLVAYCLQSLPKTLRGPDPCLPLAIPPPPAWTSGPGPYFPCHAFPPCPSHASCLQTPLSALLVSSYMLSAGIFRMHLMSPHLLCRQLLAKLRLRKQVALCCKHASHLLVLAAYNTTVEQRLLANLCQAV